jgi:hypothetical protein
VLGPGSGSSERPRIYHSSYPSSIVLVASRDNVVALMSPSQITKHGGGPTLDFQGGS